jgi:hypothetical protein
VEYITKRRSQILSNEPYEITYDDIKQMYYANQRDAEETKRVTESTYRGESYYPDDNRPGSGKLANWRHAFFKEVLYRDPKTSGFVMEYPHGVIINQGRRGSYFRGENQIYHRSIASLHRSLATLANDKERQLHQVVADMRVAEFGIFLFQTGIVQFWAQNYGTVLFEALAQHYGLETRWLDITNDFNVAMFFATCYWDPSARWWRPLTKEQTEKSKQTQYGVLFHMPAWQADLQMATAVAVTSDNEEPRNVILPIGFQPFMRCQSQYAYGIYMDEPFALQDDPNFEKLRFRHSENLSRQVYDLMEGGRKVFPQDGLDEFHDVIESIRTATSFSEEAFRYAFEKNRFFNDAQELKRELANCTMFPLPVIVSDASPFKIPRQRLRKLNRRYEGFSIEQAYGIKLTTRWVYKPGASGQGQPS